MLILQSILRMQVFGFLLFKWYYEYGNGKIRKKDYFGIIGINMYFYENYFFYVYV